MKQRKKTVFLFAAILVLAIVFWGPASAASNENDGGAAAQTRSELYKESIVLQDILYTSAAIVGFIAVIDIVVIVFRQKKTAKRKAPGQPIDKKK